MLMRVFQIPFPALPPPLDQVARFFTSPPFVKASIFPGALFVTVLVLFTIWYERKLLAKVNLRIGPLHVGRIAGILQTVADGLKLISKEVIVPRDVIKPLFLGGPVGAVFIAVYMYALLPFGGDWIIYASDISLLLLFVLIAISPIPVLLAGWGSKNKFSLVGVMRFAFQLFAYEIPMFIALTGLIMTARSFDIVKIVQAQSFLPFILLQPIGFLVFLISAIAESERVPFDMPTAESELVFGWQTEYGSVYFMMLIMALYAKLGVFTVLITLLYLGGWNGPAIPGLPSNMLEPLWVVLKSVFLLTFILILRGVYPRIRIDQMLDIGWKVLIPLGIINLLITAIILQWPALFS